jgi:NADH-quinone oxidoreductase subunit L
MVTAGVYMVCLLSPMFEYARPPRTSSIIGAITALFAATVGLTQNDIKRVIAYSTCSQLGYMFFAAGVGAYQAAMFHLFTHAFFKALLFLGAGSVIHGMHHEQDMRKMGGLWKLLPITYAVMVIGTIAITGLGFPPTWAVSPASTRRIRSSRRPSRRPQAAIRRPAISPSSSASSPPA